MKHRLLCAFAALLVAFVARAQADEPDLLDVRNSADAPVKIVFDTDIGGDIDDAFALALIHVFADRGACELLGVTRTNSNPAAAKFVAALNAQYGRPNVPVGISEGCRTHDSYPTNTIEQKKDDGSLAYPVPKGFAAQDAVKLLRKILANAKDREVVIVQVGSCANLAALLDAPGDEISPATGRELAAQKVRLVSVMGGAFALDPDAAAYEKHAEWNIVSAVPAAQKFAKEWPTEIVFSGYEVGDRIRMSPVNLKNDYVGRSRILHDAFGYWTAKNTKEGFDHRRPTWDLTSVLFVLRPEADRGYFTLSPPGDVAFDDEGRTIFTPDPNGTRRCFLQTEIERARTAEAFVNLCSQP